jgi:isocitrate dehydrogenase
MGQKPNTLKPVVYSKAPVESTTSKVALTQSSSVMELQGVDVFLYWPSRNPNTLAEAVGKAASGGLKLQVIDNRGVKVWPAGRAETFCTDSFRCRFLGEGKTDTAACLKVVAAVAEAGVEIASTQMLRTFEGQPGFSMVQGQ